MTEDTPDRRAEIRREIEALERELETLPPAAGTVGRLIDLNRERATAPNALTASKRGTP